MSNRYKKNPKKVKKQRTILGIVILAIIVVGVGIGLGAQFGAFAPIPTDTTETTPETSLSTFTLYSRVDGEDVSDFVEISVWTPEDDAEFDEIEDIYTIANFEESETSKDAEDVSIDLSAYSYVWIEIDPDGETVFSNMWYLIYGGANYDHPLYVDHLTSDVNFNLFNRDTLDEITVASYATDSNLTLLYDCPHYTVSGIHANTDDWDIDDEEWADFSDSEKAYYYDEANFRDQAPLYNPADDDEKEADSNLEKITNAFAFKLDFNDSISTVDGNANQVNLTLADDDYPVEVVISGDLIYLIFYETIDFKNGPNELRFEIEFGTDIELSDIDSGRIEVPRGDDSLGDFTKYSDIAA